ncbi:MAG: amidohydrolase family protein [Chitinophagaceae bacterium]|nr:amidohydrolase family protein [Chitinophagaceae bacterium]
MVIDSHVHFWKYNKTDYTWIDSSMKLLQKDYLPTELEATLKRNFVDGCVAVQANQTEVDTRFLAELAITHPVIKGVVGWTDLSATDAEKKLAELKAYTPIVGLRHIAQSEPDDFYHGPEFRRGLGLLQQFGYTFDLLIFPRQLRAARDLVGEFPGQTFILDHCGKPNIKKHGLEEWKNTLQELAAYPNVYCKLSGLITEAAWKDWRPSDFYPYLDVVFEAFGTGRLMFGSDWPVMLLSGMYVQWKSLLEKYTEHLLPEDKEKIFGLTARRVYGI